MALKTIMLRHKLEGKKAELDALRTKSTEFETRSAGLEAAISEAGTPEETETLDREIDAFLQEREAHDAAVAAAEEELRGLESQLEAAERAVPPAKTERGNETTMNNRKFFGMSTQERDAFFAREDVKGFLQRVRGLRGETRALTGGDLMIPTVILDVIREKIEEYSKLYKHVRVRRVPGNSRQIVLGAVPEAVWTEACGKINELAFAASGVEVDGYKVGGFIPICNALLEDDDISLAAEIITMLGQAIGLAIDKAILYGTGTKMPLGIVTRLVQATVPTDYPGAARTWVNLSTSNVTKTANTGKTLFKDIITAAGAAKNAYGSGDLFWAMNAKTHTALVANAIDVNAAGAIVSSANDTMPILGGKIEELSFVPDNVIIGGYGDMYLLAERAGADIRQSEHVRFTDDQTVFKGTAIYDGLPVIAEAFVAINIANAAITASAVTFTADAANAGAGA